MQIDIVILEMFGIRKAYRLLITVLLTAMIVIVLLSVAISFFYEKAAIRYLKAYLDEHLRTQITVDEIHFRLLKSFPDASIELRNIVVLSGENFSAADFTEIDADTLLEAKRLAFQFDFIKLLQKSYELKQINMSHGHLNLLFDKNNRNNLAVWKNNPIHSAQEENYNIALNSIHFNDMNINIISHPGKFSLTCNSNRLTLKGLFHSSMADIEARGNLKMHRLSSGNRTLIRNSDMELQIKSEYDNGQIKLEDSRILLDKLPVSVSGTIIPSRENCGVDMLIAVSGFNIKDLISLFPGDASALSDQLNAEGNGNLTLSISGNPLLQGALETNINFDISEGTIIRNRSHSRISNIDMKGSVSGIFGNNLSIQIERLASSLGNGQFSVNVSSNAQNQRVASLHVNSSINLYDLFSLIDFHSFKHISGSVASDFTAEWTISSDRPGKAYQYLSYLKNGKFFAENVDIITGNSLELQHMGGKISFDKILAFEGFSVTIDENEYLVNGTIDNLNNHLMNKDTLYANLNIFSAKMDVGNYFNKSLKSSDAAEKPVFILPSPIHLTAEIHTGELVISKFVANDLQLRMELEKDSANINNFNFKFIDGSISGNALIKFNEEPGFSVACNAKTTYVDIHELFTAFNNFSQHFIISENVQGRLDGSISFFAVWDESFKYIPKNTTATGNIEISNGELIAFEPMMKLSRYFDAKELAHVRFSTLRNRIDIDKRQITIPEMVINSSAFNITASGIHSFDNEFNYRLKVLLSEVLFNRAKSRRSEIGEFYVEKNINDQPAIPLIIAGTPDNYDVMFDKQRAFSLSNQKTQTRNGRDSAAPDPAGFIIEWEDEPASGSDLQKYTEKERQDDDFVIEWDDE